MKKLLPIILLLILVGQSNSQTLQKPKRLTIIASIGRVTSIENISNFRVSQFSASMSFSYKLTQRLSVVSLFSKSFDSRQPNLRIGLGWRIY